MSHRNLSFAVCVCLAASVAAFGQANQGTGYLFQYTGYPSASSQFLGYVATGNLAATINTNGPAGISRIIPKPDGTQFYLIGSGTTATIQSVDSTFTKFNVINGFGAAPTAAAVTPDGKYLLVAADAFYVIDTSSDVVVSTLPMTGAAAYGPDDTQGDCVSCWIAVSHDSTMAYVLTNSSFGSQVNTYNLATMTRGNSVTGLTGDATSIAVSPLNLIYVTASNRIFVIDPSALEVTTNGTLELFDFEPYALRFTPDGTTAYAANRNASLAGESMLQLNLATEAWVYWPPKGSSGVPQLDDVYVASNTRLFAFSSALATLYDVTTNPFGAVQSTSLGLPTGVVENVSAVAISTEVPSAQSLFLVVASGTQTNIYRENLSTNSTSVEGLAGLNSGELQYTVVPPESGAAAFIQFNNNQSLTPGTAGITSQPLIARVTNVSGQPVYDLPVTFSADPSSTGITVNNPTPITNANGYVQTTVSVASSATCPSSACAITLTAGAASITFTLNLPSSSGGGGTGGGGGGSSQVTIVSGDGQLLDPIFGGGGGLLQIPLTVRVTDPAGNPLQNVAVSFAVTSGTGGLTNTTATTDANGLASPGSCLSLQTATTACVYFVSEGLQPGLATETDTITATTPYGSVYFTEIVYQLDYTGGYLLDAPQVTLLAPTPSQGFNIQLAEGSVLPNGIVAQLSTVASANNPSPTPIPGFTILPLNASDDPSQPAPASCQGSTNADATGTAHCNLIAACQTGAFPLNILVANYRTFSGTVTITSGTASKLAITSGNNQSGTAGQQLQPLVATVTDGCNNVVPGIGVTWTVTQGSATLSRTVNTSNSVGQVSTTVTLGQAPGTVTVSLTGSGLPKILFTLTDSVVVSGVSVQSGNNQTAVEGLAFANPLTFLVKDNTGNPVAGILVTFSVASGSALVNPTSATSSAQGLVSTTVAAGSAAGPVVVTATAAGFTATANLTVQAPGPAITSASFYNAASFQPGLVPCGLATVIGNGIAPGVTGALSGSSGFGPLPYFLGGLSISIDGVQAPLYSISNENGAQQATFQTPCETTPGTATIAVAVNNGSPTTITGVPVFAAQPGIFTFAGTNNIQYGAVISAVDGSYVTPTHLANRGGTYYMVVTGLGQTNPTAISTNSTGVAGENVNAQIIVGVNNAGVPVISAQYLAGSIGVYIVGFQIPATASTGTNIPLAIAAITNNGGQVVYGNPVFLPGIQ